MEEKKMNQAESLAIITEMIARSNTHRHIKDGKIMLMWGYLTVAVSLLVWGLLWLTGHPAVNWLFFLIWLIGYPVTTVMRRKHPKSGVKTYVDTITKGIWSIVGYIGIIMTILCLGFQLLGGTCSWNSMLVFGLFVVGFAEAIEGTVIKEKSLIFGGSVGMLAGLITMCCIAGDVALYISWYFPIYITAFVCMMIVPGHILNAKAQKEQ